MRHAILPSMCAVAVAASCSPTLAQQAAPAAAVSPAYLNTERGLRVKTLEGREISPSLMKGMRPEEQITKRTPGVPTRPSVLLQHEGGTAFLLSANKGRTHVSTLSPPPFLHGSGMGKTYFHPASLHEARKCLL